MHQKLGLGENPIIGEVTFKERSVHRKMDASVVWDEVENKTPVANKDTIRTLDYSDAVLMTKDGTKIRLSDNSMIYIDLSEKNLNINFDYGSISTSREDGSESDTKIQIKSGDKTIQLDNGGAAKLSKNEDDHVSIQVEKGKATLALKGKEEILQTNQTAEIRDTKIDVKPIRFLLQFPPDGKYYSTNSDSMNTEFKWNPLDKGSSAELEIAKDKTFKQSVKKQSGIKDGSASIALAPGIYYWRINAKNTLGGKVEYSESRKLTIFAERSVVITTPSDGKVFTYSLKIPSIALRWTKNDFSSSYKIDISQSPDFSKLVKSLDSFENYINTDIPAKGTYYVRVTTRPNIPDLNPVISPVSKFTIEERQVPAAPDLVSPISNTGFGLDFIQRSRITFNWHDNKEFTNYELEISKSSDFSSVFVRQNSKENFVSPEIKEQIGEFFWRVRGILPDGRKSEYSKVNTFRVTEPAKLKLLFPESLSELDMNSDKSILFRWQRPEALGKFILEVSQSPDFSKNILTPEESIVTGFSKKVILASEGKYYWRVRLLTRDNKEISKSEDSSFTILGAPTPKPITPSEGTNIDLSNQQSVDFSWSRNEKATAYNVEIYDTTKGGKRLIGNITTSDTSTSYKDLSKFRDGNFLWAISILYETKDKRTIKSPPAITKFTVQAPKVEPPTPIALQPLNGADLIMGEKEEVMFQWEKNEKAVYYQIDVQEKSRERTKPVFQKQTTEPNALFEIPITVGEGVFYWDLFIFYKTWDGRVVRSNPIRNEFSLKFPYRNPPMTVLTTPTGGQDIKPDDNWNVPLVWEPNERAISYNVQVSEFETNKTVFKETLETTRTTFVVSDTAIKPGKYIWSVSINYKAKDERIVKSPSRKQEFNLVMPSFEVPVSIAISPEADTVINPINVSEVEFKWEKSNSALLYTVELFEITDGRQALILKKDSRENSFLFKDIPRLTNGVYMWKLTIAYKDRKLKTIYTEPLMTEFYVKIPAEDMIEPPQILSKPRLYVE